MFTNYSEQVQGVIIKLGEAMFNHLGLNELSDEEILIKYNKGSNIDLIRSSYEETILQIQENNDEINVSTKKMYLDVISDLESKITMNDKIMEGKILDALESKEEYFKLEKKNLETEIGNLRKNQDVKEMIEERFCDKKDFKNPTEQGDYAEKVFDYIVEKGLPFDNKARIEDTSGDGGSGDRIIKFGNGIVLMVEVKNKDIIKKSDIDEFEGHYTKDFKENKIDCAIFCSYRTPTIPNRCKAVVNRYFENDKVVYFGVNDNLTPIEKKEKFLQSIEEVYIKLSDKKENNKAKDTLDNVSNIYNLHLKDLKEQKVFHTEKIKDSEKDNKYHSGKLSEIYKRLNSLYRDIQNNKVEIDKTLLDDKLYKIQLIERVKEWRDKSENGMKKDWKKFMKKEIDMSEYDKQKLNGIKVSDL
tara:strand:+ start:3038 stop:4282 length:1245 start_codon:yes stop_codon:yes gene_type:complete